MIADHLIECTYAQKLPKFDKGLSPKREDARLIFFSTRTITFYIEKFCNIITLFFHLTNGEQQGGLSIALPPARTSYLR